jgi:hypothetical protein
MEKPLLFVKNVDTKNLSPLFNPRIIFLINGSKEIYIRHLAFIYYFCSQEKLMLSN